MRKAVFQIWLNRDYTEYGKVTQRDLSLPNWSPAARMRLYIRKDIASKLWNYGSAPAAEDSCWPIRSKGNRSILSANAIYRHCRQPSRGSSNARAIWPSPRMASSTWSIPITTASSTCPRMASRLQVWGSFADATKGDAPGGTFNQPWGIGARTGWLGLCGRYLEPPHPEIHRQGEFVTMWGYFGQGEKPEAFWGPRDVAVDSAGRVFVTDTGNKRVVVFDRRWRTISPSLAAPGWDPASSMSRSGLAVDPGGSGLCRRYLEPAHPGLPGG